MYASMRMSTGASIYTSNMINVRTCKYLNKNETPTGLLIQKNF